MALRHDDCPGVTTIGPEAERHPVNAVQTDARNMQEALLTVHVDLYLAAIVTAMFLAGCVLVILNARE